MVDSDICVEKDCSLDEEDYLEENDNTLHKYEDCGDEKQKVKSIGIDDKVFINEKKTSRSKKKNMKMLKKIETMNDFIDKDNKMKNILFLKTTKVKRKKSLKLYNKFKKSKSKSKERKKNIKNCSPSKKKFQTSKKKDFLNENESLDLKNKSKSPLYMKSLKSKKNKVMINSLDEFSKEKFTPYCVKRIKKKNKRIFIK